MKQNKYILAYLEIILSLKQSMKGLKMLIYIVRIIVQIYHR